MISPRRLARREAKKAAKAAGLPPPKFKRGEPVPTPEQIWAQAGKSPPVDAPKRRQRATPATQPPSPASGPLNDPEDLLGSAPATPTAAPAAPTGRRRRKAAPAPSPAAEDDASDLLGEPVDVAEVTGEGANPEALGCYSSTAPPYHVVLVVDWGRKYVHYVPVAAPLALKRLTLGEFKRHYVNRIPGKQHTPDSAARLLLSYKHPGTEGARKALENLAGYDLL